MAGSQRERAASKRRPPVVWDHRKDKFMLLALFSQLNIKTADFDQLADVLGSEVYSASALRRRFKELREAATEVFDDRQDRNADVSIVENHRDHDDDILEFFRDRPAVQRVAPNLPTSPQPRIRSSPVSELSASSKEPAPPRGLELFAQPTPPSSASSTRTRPEIISYARPESSRSTLATTSASKNKSPAKSSNLKSNTQHSPNSSGKKRKRAEDDLPKISTSNNNGQDGNNQRNAHTCDDRKVFCSYWIRNGECDFMQQGCIYKHEMPHDLATLERLGFNDIPRWYRKKYRISSLKKKSAESPQAKVKVNEPPRIKPSMGSGTDASFGQDDDEWDWDYRALPKSPGSSVVYLGNPSGASSPLASMLERDARPTQDPEASRSRPAEPWRLSTIQISQSSSGAKPVSSSEPSKKWPSGIPPAAPKRLWLSDMPRVTR
ncbi:uncharacterized protein DSM5745_08250 [Aspergillus mulundensis]|uniref:C3H1-type domain-containing protein n=1 Tax=Aspergillus mulundensis TaxID=1810919 RepID=A0A3D8R9L1_9EURO|nr:hypothetical protein DSM5745_08250 [Aspergillus mulundensis]RDW70739.1 hypothetical protein DSM5745_08250 [Aspergillus mulundensis]